jgi:alpha-mannosidase
MLKHVRLTENRIHTFLQESRRCYYAAQVPLAATFTHDIDPIPFAELGRRTWQPIAVGARWGGNWESAWFKFTGTVPPEWAGQEVWAVIDTGSEACVFDAEGQPVCGLTSGDERSRKGLVAVARPARGGEPVEILVEAAANHLFGYLADCFLKEANLVLFRRDRWDFIHDFYFLNGLQHALPEDHPRRARIRYALNEAINRYGQGTPEEVRAARQALADPLSRRANASAHWGSAIGHAHIDVAWLWPLRETLRKCARTFSSALCYMEEYPDYKFGASQAQLYAFTKEHYPALYERIKEAVRAGRWEVQGGMWVEADCNIPSGESLVRQLLHGKRFFLEEFGIEVDNLWLPDVFGYSAALPQILRKAGVSYFLTQKISWNQFNKFPHHTFRWEGIDGSWVFAHFPPSDTYNCDFEPSQLIFTCRNFAEKDRTDRWIYLFGFGDGGGGPSRHHLELAQRARDCEELPRMVQEFARDFFPKAEAAISDLPYWRGELYLELHRGTLTSQARNKRFNRQSELRLREAEFLSSAFPEEYPRAELDRVWKRVLLNQFHDILPGSSITWVYQDSAKQYTDILNVAAQTIQTAGQRWAAQVDTRGPGRPVVAINPLSWSRTEVLAIPLEAGESEVTVADAGGRALPTQIQAGQALVQATAPALGHTVLFVKPERPSTANPLRVSLEEGRGALLENEILQVEFDAQGDLIRLFDKEAQREALVPGERGNALALYEDLPANWEAWDVDIFYEEKAPAETVLRSWRPGETGPVRASLVQERDVGEKSKLVQEIRLAAGSRRLEFVTWVDWHEDRKMLRTAFPTTVRADQATFEIQYGHLQRPTHRNTSWDMARFEVVAHKWVDLSDPTYGVALLNDCKYGHKVHRHILDLNLLRSPKSPDPQADMGEHEFTYALFPHPGGYREGGVIQEGYALNVPLLAFPTTAHDGPLAPTFSRFTVNVPNVIVEVVKLAEDNDDLILRLYEAYGQPTRAALRGFPAPVRAYRTDLLERNEEELAVVNGTLDLTFGPFEILTVRWVRE